MPILRTYDIRKGKVFAILREANGPVGTQDA